MADPIDAVALRARLAASLPGRRAPDVTEVPPGAVAVPAGSDDARALGGPSPTPAAVLVPLVSGPAPGVLLTKRTAHLRKHAGQVSFPGGRIDPDDASSEAAALREAWEEIGLAADAVDVIGQLPDYVTGTGFLVTPVVGVIEPGHPLRLSPDEVEAVFILPMSVLLDPEAPQRRRVRLGGDWREFWVWPHPEHYIWGATAAILVGLADLLRRGE